MTIFCISYAIAIVLSIAFSLIRKIDITKHFYYFGCSVTLKYAFDMAALWLVNSETKLFIICTCIVVIVWSFIHASLADKKNRWFLYMMILTEFLLIAYLGVGII